ncbi:MEDS domain-containing protein, partial [Candidatus Parcubacteria bacterium]|nr:MEDS domain-containing protein [Candidatus Parcubacteria bacterium]
MMKEETRKMGVDVIGNIPWGTHICLFYQTAEDLIDILVPYFKAGLENNEFCMWVTSEPLNVEDAKRALKREIKELDEYVERGQIEFLDYRQWYTESGRFEADRVLHGWVEKEQQAVKRGWAGLRLTGNTFWLGKEDWRAFADYEAMVDHVVGEYRMIAICTYSLDTCGTPEIVDVVSNHQFALIRRGGEWEVIESARRRQAEQVLRESEERFRAIVQSTNEAIIIADSEGRIVSWNEGAQRIFLYTEEEMSGQRIAALMPERYRVLHLDAMKRLHSTGEARLIGKTYEVHGLRKDGSEFPVEISLSAWGTAKGEFFGAIIRDITERKRVEEAEREQRALAEALCDTAAALSSTLYLDEVLDRILTNVERVVPCDSVNVMLIESGVANIACHRGYAERWLEEFARSLRFTLDDTATLHHMVETGKPLIIPDTQTYPQWVDIPETRWIRSYAGVPIRVKGKTVGFLNLDSVTPGFYTPAHAERLQAFAAQAAVAIENAWLYEDVRDSCDIQLRTLEELDKTTLQLRQRADQMVMLMETNRAITEDIGFKETLERILIYARRIVPVSDCSMTLVDESSGDLVVQVSTDGEAGLRINPADPSAVGWVIATKQILVEENVSANPIFNQQLVQRYGMKSGLVVPIIYKDRAIGALAFGETQGRRAFTDAEKMMAQAFAYQVAIAIENARLYEEVRAGRERLQTLSRKLVEAQEVERRHIARELHDEIGQALTGLKLALEISALSPAETVKTRLDEAKTLVGELLARVRELSLDLRPGMLDDLGLLPALLWHFERYTAQTGVQVDIKCTVLEGQRFPPEVETAAYRIMQEALTNVARHAGVRLAAVRLWASQDMLNVQIEDQGIGFNSKAALANEGNSGLTGMH